MCKTTERSPLEWGTPFDIKLDTEVGRTKLRNEDVICVHHWILLFQLSKKENEMFGARGLRGT
jgi:hypothetical protein